LLKVAIQGIATPGSRRCRRDVPGRRRFLQGELVRSHAANRAFSRRMLAVMLVTANIADPGLVWITRHDYPLAAYF